MIVVTKERLVLLFRGLADRIEAGDSYSGVIEYDSIGYDGAPDLKEDEFLLRARYRYGNLYGQGGMKVIE